MALVFHPSPETGATHNCFGLLRKSDFNAETASGGLMGSRERAAQLLNQKARLGTPQGPVNPQGY